MGEAAIIFPKAFVERWNTAAADKVISTAELAGIEVAAEETPESEDDQFVKDLRTLPWDPSGNGGMEIALRGSKAGLAMNGVDVRFSDQEINHCLFAVGSGSLGSKCEQGSAGSGSSRKSFSYAGPASGMPEDLDPFWPDQADRHWALSLGYSGIATYTPIGEPVDQTFGAFALSAEWMAGVRGEQAKPYFGLYAHLPLHAEMAAGDANSFGLRVGVVREWESFQLRYGLTLGYLSLRDKEQELDDTPVTVTGVTPDRSAYIALYSGPLERTFTGALFLLNSEPDFAIYRTDSSGFSLNLFVGLGAGLVAGTVSDEGCNYTVQQEDPRVERFVDEFRVSSPQAFGTRCREAESALGVAARFDLGLRGEL